MTIWSVNTHSEVRITSIAEKLVNFKSHFVLPLLAIQLTVTRGTLDINP